MMLRCLFFLFALLPFSIPSAEPKSYEPGYCWTAHYKKNFLTDNPFFPFFVELDQDLEKIPIGDYYLCSKLKLLERMLPFARIVAEEFELRLQNFILSLHHYQMAPTKELIPVLRKELDELSLCSFQTLESQQNRNRAVNYGAALKLALIAFREHLEQIKDTHSEIEMKNLSDHEELICLLADNMHFSSNIEDGIEILDEKLITFTDEPSPNAYDELIRSIKKLETDLTKYLPAS